MGLDTETQPAYSKTDDRPPTSLLQIACRDEADFEDVVIFDLLVLLPKCARELNECLQGPFQDPNIVKVGQSLAKDIEELYMCYPYCECFATMTSVVEATQMHREIGAARYPHLPKGHDAVALKKLVAEHLGQELVKKMQKSPWGKRPLLPQQMEYAACDALALVRLYYSMEWELQALAVDFRIAQLCRTHQFQLKPDMRECCSCGQIFPNPKWLERHQRYYYSKCKVHHGRRPALPPGAKDPEPVLEQGAKPPPGQGTGSSAKKRRKRAAEALARAGAEAANQDEAETAEEHELDDGQEVVVVHLAISAVIDLTGPDSPKEASKAVEVEVTCGGGSSGNKLGPPEPESQSARDLLRKFGSGGKKRKREADVIEIL